MSEGRHRGMTLTLALIMTVTTLLAATPADAHHGPSRRGKPDLVVKSGGLIGGGLYVTRSGSKTFHWGAVIKNVGDRTAPRSHGQVEFVIGPGVSHAPRGARFAVPSLAPGASQELHGKFTVKFDDAWDFGTYPTRICADGRKAVPEADEGNNCEKNLRGLQDFNVVPGSLEGSISGRHEGPLGPGVKILWQGDVTLNMFTTKRLAADGIFRYLWADGPLNYWVSGTSSLSGCTWTGSGPVEPNEGQRVMTLQFRPVRSTYWSGFVVPDPNAAFPVAADCPGDDFAGPFHPENPWLNTGPFTLMIPTLGMTELDDGYTFGPDEWLWDLTAMT